MKRILQFAALSVVYLISFIIYYSGLFKVIVFVRKKILKKTRVIVLAYHSIADYSPVYANKKEFITPIRQFRRQVSYLKNNFHIVPFEEFKSILQNGRVNEDIAVLTFDDGHRDVFSNALSIISEFKLPAVFFLTTGFIGRENYLTWEQVNMMRARGFEFGCHTVTHPHLDRISSDMVKREVMESKLELEKRIGKEINYFSYPYGDYNESVVSIIKECGFSAAVTTEDSNCDLSSTDLFRINRKTVLNRPFCFFVLKIEGLFEGGFWEYIRKKIFY
ncbi:MAG: polysaccharide deacetylase family protein [Candidatus Omnitrophota bacterium]|jgi:peptidoglycan/xylan/chitin deacetylase (PgdA/CDA1 family)|nr:MAG: polysaccharide deacetylase family protein [Candidatus Omnitrophota bacterium]